MGMMLAANSSILAHLGALRRCQCQKGEIRSTNQTVVAPAIESSAPLLLESLAREIMKLIRQIIEWFP
jgi:hypothetical protein